MTKLAKFPRKAIRASSRSSASVYQYDSNRCPSGVLIVARIADWQQVNVRVREQKYRQNCRESGDKDKTLVTRRSAISRFYAKLPKMGEDCPKNPEEADAIAVHKERRAAGVTVYSTSVSGVSLSNPAGMKWLIGRFHIRPLSRPSCKSIPFLSGTSIMEQTLV